MKLPGAKEVKFEEGEKPGTQKITLVSEESGVSKEDAVKSLGKKATRFVVVKWSAPDTAAAEPEKGAEEGAEKDQKETGKTGESPQG